MTQPEYDDLWPGGPRFVRSGAGFALGTDSVLLADFAAQRRARRIADLGCCAHWSRRPPSALNCSRTRHSSRATTSEQTA